MKGRCACSAACRSSRVCAKAILAGPNLQGMRVMDLRPLTHWCVWASYIPLVHVGGHMWKEGGCSDCWDKQACVHACVSCRTVRCGAAYRCSPSCAMPQSLYSARVLLLLVRECTLICSRDGPRVTNWRRHKPGMQS